MCILGAAPFALLGFITYHGMTAEQFIWAWLRSEMLEPKELKFEDSNYYYINLSVTPTLLAKVSTVMSAFARAFFMISPSISY